MEDLHMSSLSIGGISKSLKVPINLFKQMFSDHNLWEQYLFNAPEM